jgi:hypothetical protein
MKKKADPSSKEGLNLCSLETRYAGSESIVAALW